MTSYTKIDMFLLHEYALASAGNVLTVVETLAKVTQVLLKFDKRRLTPFTKN